MLDALPDCIGEDLELARALSAKGLTVKQAGRARMPYGGASVPQVLARFTRWMQVLKAHRPSLFPTIPLLFCCTPVLLVAAHLSGDGMARAAVAALVSLRLILASVLERRPGLYVSWLFAEVLLLACWVRAVLAGSRVKWRGRELVVGAHGVLDPEQRS
ncbi:MAG: hypothetical protein IPJ65_29340 [Archangiaceae bacterium]|nr:hypothetical protein [Archangiaceae bacterium]